MHGTHQQHKAGNHAHAHVPQPPTLPVHVFACMRLTNVDDAVARGVLVDGVYRVPSAVAARVGVEVELRPQLASFVIEIKRFLVHGPA